MAEDIVIRAEGLGKKYVIGHEADGESYGSLRDTVAAAASGLLGRLGGKRPAARSFEDFWALRDLDFELHRGDIVGVIGRNGAGKSTLLKLLSRITDPSEGRAMLHGRVASLLEVGTGFHPELTGRENIFLNGAILGMSRREIRAKFDAIVDFAEIERFLDTPVKRYSSGMYVRLAFAVAAFLDPEILIIDEVLAVGDAEFQKKCLGKMHDVSQSGRTILFVSHNMAAVKSLTTRSIVLQRGQLVFDGTTEGAIDAYGRLAGSAQHRRKGWGRGTHTRIRTARLIDARGEPSGSYAIEDPLRIEVEIETDGTRSLSLDAMLVDAAKSKIALAASHHFGGVYLPAVAGAYRFVFELAPVPLASGIYTIDIVSAITNQQYDHHVEDAIEFEVIHCNPGGLTWDFRQGYQYGAFALPFASAPRFDIIDGGNSP